MNSETFGKNNSQAAGRARRVVESREFPHSPQQFAQPTIQNAVSNFTEIAPKVVRAGGLEPPRAFAQRIFLPTTVFTAAFRGVWSLDYPFTLAPALGAARLVSTPSQNGLGSRLPCKSMRQVPSNLSSSTRQFPIHAPNNIKSVASTIPPRPLERIP